MIESALNGAEEEEEEEEEGGRLLLEGNYQAAKVTARGRKREMKWVRWTRRQTGVLVLTLSQDTGFHIHYTCTHGNRKVTYACKSVSHWDCTKIK